MVDLLPHHTPILQDDDDPDRELARDMLPTYSSEEHFLHMGGIDVEKKKIQTFSFNHEDHDCDKNHDQPMMPPQAKFSVDREIMVMTKIIACL